MPTRRPLTATAPASLAVRLRAILPSLSPLRAAGGARGARGPARGRRQHDHRAGAEVRHLGDHGHPVLPDPRPVRLPAAPPDPGHRVRPGRQRRARGRQRHRPGGRPRGDRREDRLRRCPGGRGDGGPAWTWRRCRRWSTRSSPPAAIDVYGVGASAFVAMDFQQKLHRIGQVAFAWSDTHIALTSAALLQPGDVAIGISHTGVTTDTIDALDRGPPQRSDHRRPHQLPALAHRRGGRPRAHHGGARDDVPQWRDGEPAGAADPGRLPVRRGRPADHRQTRAALEATLAAVSGHRLKRDRGGSTKRGG